MVHEVFEDKYALNILGLVSNSGVRGVSQQLLVRTSGVSRPTLWSTVCYLQELGLVSKNKAMNGDRRFVFVNVTATGEMVAELLEDIEKRLRIEQLIQGVEYEIDV